MRCQRTASRSIFSRRIARRLIEHRADAATVAPATGTGATLAPIQPFIFSKSIAPLLGIDMPTVGIGRLFRGDDLHEALSAAAKAKGAAEESTAAVLTPARRRPRGGSRRAALAQRRRVSRRSGKTNFESAPCATTWCMTVSDEYDRQCITRRRRGAQRRTAWSIS